MGPLIIGWWWYASWLHWRRITSINPVSYFWARYHSDVTYASWRLNSPKLTVNSTFFQRLYKLAAIEQLWLSVKKIFTLDSHCTGCLLMILHLLHQLIDLIGTFILLSIWGLFCREHSILGIVMAAKLSWDLHSFLPPLNTSPNQTLRELRDALYILNGDAASANIASANICVDLMEGCVW